MNINLKSWLQATRPFSFTASMVPVLAGAALAFALNDNSKWLFLPLIIICSLLYHAATNLVSDYCDYKKGVDKNYTLGGSRAIQQNLLKPNQLLITGLLMFAVASLIGLIFVYYRGVPILTIGIIGLLGGILYTATPLAYKYFALGDIFVFILMGPLMVIGSYIVLTGTYTNSILYISLPIGFLVAAILWANNLRDITHDTQAKIKTMAIILGHKNAKLGYYSLIIAAYISIVVMIFTKTLSPFALITFITLPLAIKDIKTAHAAKQTNPQAIATFDAQTAQLHLAFGVLLIISIILSTIF